MNLTDEQRQIAAAPPNAKMLVTAGPGTGKTHTLIARLNSLIENYELAGASEILVLSFSRAAVRAIRERVGAMDKDSEVRFVRAYTFDSFATQLLSRIAPDGDWTNLSFDKRIEAATYLIHKHPEAQETLRAFGHIMIDELQDVVGVRDEMVRAVLETAAQGPGGWTLLGDPAQGIYNFSLTGEARKIGSAVMYGWLRARFKGVMQEHTLTVNHRAQSVDAKKLAAKLSPFGLKMGTAKPDYTKVRLGLEDVLLELDDFGDLKSTLTMAALKTSTPTAILCRTNGQALLLSRWLHEQGVPHRYQRGATDRALPAWIGVLFHDFEGNSISKSTFSDLCAERLADADVDEYFRALRRTGIGKGKDGLDLEQFARRLRDGNLPDELCEQPQSTLTVSTVHRAKGLEFERVVILWSEDDLGQDDDIDQEEETRVLYVALTRPRRLLYRTEMLARKGFMVKNSDTDRWARKFSKWKVGDFEVRGEDSHHVHPAGGFGCSCDVPESQKYIPQSVKPNDPVVLKKIETQCEDGAPRCHYIIEHEGRPIGVTGEKFGRDLYFTLKAWPRFNVRWPERIEGLRVDAVDTVAGNPDTGRKCGLGNTGLWLRVRVAGLGALRFGSSDE